MTTNLTLPGNNRGPGSSRNYCQGHLFPEVSRDASLAGSRDGSRDAQRPEGDGSVVHTTPHKNISRDFVERKQPSTRSPFPSPTGPEFESGIGLSGRRTRQSKDARTVRNPGSEPGDRSWTNQVSSRKPNRPEDASPATPELCDDRSSQARRRARGREISHRETSTTAMQAPTPGTTLRSGDFLREAGLRQGSQSRSGEGIRPALFTARRSGPSHRGPATETEVIGRRASNTNARRLRVRKLLNRTAQNLVTDSLGIGFTHTGSDFEQPRFGPRFGPRVGSRAQLESAEPDSTAKEILTGVTLMLVLASLLFVASMAA